MFVFCFLEIIFQLIVHYFSAIITEDVVNRTKPDPEMFLLAAKQIGVSPKNCLVFEDGIHGMQAAQRAKMKCVGLVEDKTKNYPTKNLISSFAEINLDYIKGL